MGGGHATKNRCRHVDHTGTSAGQARGRGCLWTRSTRDGCSRPSFPRLTISRLHLISFGNGSNARAASTFTGCNKKGHRTLAGKGAWVKLGESPVDRQSTKRGATGPVERKGAPHRLRNTVRAGTTIDAPSLTHPTHQLASSSSIK